MACTLIAFVPEMIIHLPGKPVPNQGSRSVPGQNLRVRSIVDGLGLNWAIQKTKSGR